MPPDHYHNYATILSYTSLQLKCQGWIFVKGSRVHQIFHRSAKHVQAPPMTEVQQYSSLNERKYDRAVLLLFKFEMFIFFSLSSCHWRLLYLTLKPFHYCPINNLVNKLRPLTTLLLHLRQRQLISWADLSVNTSMLLVQSPSNQI